MTDALATGAYSAGWSGVRLLPEAAAYAMFDQLADVLWRRQGRGVARLEANLLRVSPDLTGKQLRALSRKGMRSYLRYWCDVFRLPDWDTERFLDRTTVVGEAHLRDALAAGTGFVAALPHMGNWDHVGGWACATGAPVTTVAERLRPEAVYERFLAVRRKLGIKVLPLTGGDSPLERLSARLRENGLVCLLSERDLPRNGIPVDFFGARTTMPPGPALLSVLTGAPLHAVSTAYLPGEGEHEGRGGAHRLQVTIGPRIPLPDSGTTREKVAAMTQQLAHAFEERIRASPEDWHMLQRIWPDETPAKDGPR